MMLISAEELAARLGDPALRIADVRWYVGEPERGRREYDEGHLPGAIFVDLDRDLAAPSGPGRHPLPDPAAFAARMAELGIGREDLVVAYDDSLGTIAARLWWMLDSLGHEHVALLDGGLKAWRAAGLPLSTDRVTFPAGEPLAARAWSGVIDRRDLMERLDEVALLDARAPERYRGETEPVDPRPGHIPSAINAPARVSLDSDGRFLLPTALAERLGAVAPAQRPVVVSCGSGVTACHTAFAFRLAGLPDPVLYPGSYSDWSRTDLPVATGPEPGEPVKPHAGS
ncbi:MAG TPA: sulfurtransferase [Candidatus Dormibacteraeota bacterium]|nr:sulfurtransferase [Candidatus Dormibacteraeota bacterium]